MLNLSKLVYTLHEITSLYDYIINNNLHLSSTLIVFDLDNTILRMSSYLGSDEWVHMKLLQIENKVNSCNIKTKHELFDSWALWISKNRPDMYPVEFNSTIETINKLLQTDVKIIILSSRSKNLYDESYEQLKKNILTEKFYHADSGLIYEKENVIFKSGISLVSGMNKGHVLNDLLNHFKLKDNYEPEHLIFIDDMEKHLIDIHQTISGVNLSLFHYVYTHKNRLQLTEEEIISIDKEWIYFLKNHTNIFKLRSSL